MFLRLIGMHGVFGVYSLVYSSLRPAAQGVGGVHARPVECLGAFVGEGEEGCQRYSWPAFIGTHS